MSDRPKPPEGYETWVDSVLDEVTRQYNVFTPFNVRREHARAELAELRNKVDEQEKEIERLRGELQEYDEYNEASESARCQCPYCFCASDAFGDVICNSCKIGAHQG